MPKEKKTDPSKSAERKAAPKRNVAREIRRRRERPLVVSSLPGADQRAMHAMVLLARELECDLVDLEVTGGVLLSDRQPAGALVNHSLTGEFWPRLQKMGCPIIRYGSWPHVPEEVALLSMGNSHVCELSPVPLSAIDSHVDEKGRQSLLTSQPRPSRLSRGSTATRKSIRTGLSISAFARTPSKPAGNSGRIVSMKTIRRSTSTMTGWQGNATS